MRCRRWASGGMAGLLIALAMIVVGAAHAAGDGAADSGVGNWQPIQQGSGREDINTWVRPVEGLPVKAFRGETEVPYTVPVVLAVLADVRNLANWVYQGQFSDHIATLTPDHIYMRFNGVWPADDRDVLIHIKVHQQGEAIVVDSRGVDGLVPKNINYVRIPRLHNTFKLTPLKAGWTRIEFETQVDPGGWVPSWLANMVATKAPLVTLQGLRSQLSKPKYQIKSMSELPANYPVEGTPTLPDWHFKSAP